MSSERHTMQPSLAVLTAGGLHIKLIFGKDLKSVKFHSLIKIKKGRRFKIELKVTNIFNTFAGLHSLA